MNDNQSSGNAEKKVGPIVATLIIVLILIIAALYLFASKMNQPTIPTDGAAMDQAAAPGTPSDMDSMQSDLNTSTNGLDQQNF